MESAKSFLTVQLTKLILCARHRYICTKVVSATCFAENSLWSAAAAGALLKEWLHEIGREAVGVQSQHEALSFSGQPQPLHLFNFELF